MDIFDKETRSNIMSRIRAKNTKPELSFRKALFAKGFRYKIHDKKLPGTPDVVLPKYKTIIFIHGCFWHGHDCRKRKTFPVTNSDYWKTKIEQNKIRDTVKELELRRLGWNVFVIWECQIKTKNLLKNVVDDISMRLKMIKSQS